MPTADGALWCPRHNEERHKLYTNYKAHHALLNAYPDNPACHDIVNIMACSTFTLLREWNTYLRGKYNLLTRCIEARVYFSERFFGNDMDFGHKTFWEGLVRKRSEVEKLMFHVETRGYQLILKGQNALWVLEREPDSHESGDCSGYDDRTLGTDTSFHSVEGANGDTIEDPLETVLREKAIEFREKIRTRLARYCAPSMSRFHDERLRVIYAYVRRAVYKDPALMFHSQSYDSVMALLSDNDLDLVTMERIWNSIKALCVHDVQAAVDDVLRANEEGDHVVVLGGKVFKDVSGEPWPLHAWGHMMAIHQCYSCLRTTCQTIDEVIDLTRYALFSRTPLSQTCLKYDYGFDGSKELILAGFIPSDIPLSSPRHSIVSTECGLLSAGPVWEETKRNLSLYAGLSLNDPKAQAFVNGCFRHSDLMVMVRKGPEGRVIRSKPVVWTSRKRHARSPSGLANISWEKTTDVTRCKDSILEEAQPSGWGHEKIADCLQVVIVDEGDGNMGDFVRKLVQVWCQVYQVNDKDELYAALEGPYEAAGELEKYTCDHHQVTYNIPIIQKDVLNSYQSLWGTMPPAALVEDPNRFRFSSDSF
ncbi:hypothetical protein HYDPIDRAFT_29372 [Hydnomerulius pinastri MD-312]|uniref:Uncharacterized protein n=1 Tax=Hydnomerulius pinastri MD-312 TaxID=994086 RepID=A0A0C9W849_9AGAM|nr:hypothetical protein HYDPIDRAFT_29372 [Hydnomerulius pinastri MD-312]